MNTAQETLGAFFGLVVTLAVLVWYWGTQSLVGNSRVSVSPDKISAHCDEDHSF